MSIPATKLKERFGDSRKRRPNKLETKPSRLHRTLTCKIRRRPIEPRKIGEWFLRTTTGLTRVPGHRLIATALPSNEFDFDKRTLKIIGIDDVVLDTALAIVRHAV